MATLNLRTVANGSVILSPTSTATDKTITLPATDGTMVVQDSSNITSVANLNFTGTGGRITGDFSNATAANRVAFQSSTTNGATVVNIAPNGTSTNASIIAFSDSAIANSSFLQMRCDSTAEARFTSGAIGSGTSLPMTFYTGGSERLRLDTSGNLGLGVTPSAWNSAWKAFQIGPRSAITSGTGDVIDINCNLYRNASNVDVYIASDYASRYRQLSGGHYWSTAPSGTAGNTISFTTAMTLNASGNLLVGGTTDKLRLSVYSASANIPTLGTASGTVLLAGSDPAYGLMMGTSGSGYSWMQAQRTDGTATAYNLLLQPSGGNLLVGTTNASDTAGSGVKIIPGTTSYVSTVGAETTNANSSYLLYSTGAAAYRFYVGYAGTVFATNTTITALSDQRLKENIQDIDVGLDAVMALKPRKFDWKEGKGKGIKGDRGWIAQEFEQVFPDMIDTWRDPAPEGEEPYKAVNANLIPILVKAIQELTARLEVLENK